MDALTIMVAIFGGFKCDFSGPVIFAIVQTNENPTSFSADGVLKGSGVGLGIRFSPAAT